MAWSGISELTMQHNPIKRQRALLANRAKSALHVPQITLVIPVHPAMFKGMIAVAAAAGNGLSSRCLIRFHPLLRKLPADQCLHAAPKAVHEARQTRSQFKRTVKKHTERVSAAIRLLLG